MNFAALKFSGFRLYYIGVVAFVNAMWILRIVIGWLAWDLTGSASFVGLIASMSLLPSFLSGPVFGVLVDRADIRYAALAANVATVAVALVLALLLQFGFLTNLTLSVIALAMGFITSAHHPVRMSLGPRLVDREYVSSVVALSAINFNLARMISPAIGGLLIDRVGAMATLLVTIALFIPNFILLPRLRPRPLPSNGTPSKFSEAFTSGLAYSWRILHARYILMMTALLSLGIRGILEVLPVIADGIFERGASGLGQISAAVGVGALSAAIFKAVGVYREVDGMPKSVFAMFPVGVAAMLMLSITQNWTVAMAMAGVLGMCGTFMGVTLQQALQTKVPDEMRGRVMSLWAVLGLSATAVGALIIGLLTEHLGMVAAGTMSTVATVALFLWLFAASRAIHSK